MSFHIAKLSRGPAFISYRGATFFSKSPVKLTADLESYDISVEGLTDVVSKRKKGTPLKIDFTPCGEWEALTVLHPHRTRAIGAQLNDILKAGSLNTTTDVWTWTAHGLPAGTRVRLAKKGSATFPTLSSGAITDTTDYYVSVTDANNLKFHPTLADALAGTNALNFTVAHTGTIRLVAIYPLTIYPFDPNDEPVTFHNALVTVQPDIIGSTQATLFGSVTFEALPVPGMDRTSANSIYTASGITAGSVSAFDPSAILTLPYTHTWGAAAPWDSFGTEKGFTLKAPIKTSPIMSDEDALVGYTLDDLAAMVTMQPKGLDLDDLLAKMKIQGAGAEIGAAIEGADPDDLDMASGTEVFVRLYNAGLTGGPANWTKSEDRLGELNWFAARRFTAGVADPLYFLGTESPD